MGEGEMAPSLGEMLRAQEACEKAHCLQELEQKASAKGLCAERDLQLVKDFFHQAVTQFTNCILARVELKPLYLGDGQNATVSQILQTFRWKLGKDIRDPAHPYHAVWTPFQTWCDENELSPVIEERRKGKEYCYALKVRSKAVDLASADETSEQLSLV
jgi:hypothetical protein